MRTSQLLSFLVFFCLLFLFTSCNKDDESEEMEMEEPDEMNPGNPDDDTFKVESIQGLSQKGPYLIGSSITILELESNLSPTGRSFSENITNNLGSFEISNLELASSFVELQASGFYFNEVTGVNSEAQINLSAIVDLTDQSSINVNLLTTLEKNRVENLIGQGMSFGDAKAQALAEVLNVFEINDSTDANAEQLNIAQAGNGNAILLAISAILQGNHSVAEVSELISKISLGLESDGLFEDDVICSQLSTAASFVNPTNIRGNLESWYNEANTSVSIPAFEPFLTQYVQNTPCQAESNITYPQSGLNGPNILSPENVVFDVNETYSLHADLEQGTSLKVRVVGNNWVFNSSQGDTGWFFEDWDAEANDINRGRIFSSTREGLVDLAISLRQPFQNGLYDNKIRFELFENGSTVPTKTIIREIQGVTPRPAGSLNLYLTTPSTTGPTENLLTNFFRFGALSPTIRLDEDHKNGFGIFLPENFTVEILVSGQNFAIDGFNEGWTIELLNETENLWRLSASELGYYEADVNMLFSQGCVTLNTEVIVNGESFGTFFRISEDDAVNFFTSSFGEYGRNILSNNTQLESGDISMHAELEQFGNDSPNNLTVRITGTGWSIPTPIENINWLIGDYDNTSQSQTFVATIDGSDNINDLKLNIANFNSSNPPDIFVEIMTDKEGCGTIPLDSFKVRF